MKEPDQIERLLDDVLGESVSPALREVSLAPRTGRKSDGCQPQGKKPGMQPLKNTCRLLPVLHS